MRDPLEEALAIIADLMAVDLGYGGVFHPSECRYSQGDAFRMLDRYGWIHHYDDGMCKIPQERTKETSNA